MSTELVRDNLNIFQAFSEGMYNDHLERFVEKRHAGSSLFKGPATMVLNKEEKERR